MLTEKEIEHYENQSFIQSSNGDVKSSSSSMCASDDESFADMMNKYVNGDLDYDSTNFSSSDSEDEKKNEDKKRRKRLDRIMDYRYYKHLLHKQARKIIEVIEDKHDAHNKKNKERMKEQERRNKQSRVDKLFSNNQLKFIRDISTNDRLRHLK